jgi:hypothetical protein
MQAARGSSSAPSQPPHLCTRCLCTRCLGTRCLGLTPGCLPACPPPHLLPPPPLLPHIQRIQTTIHCPPAHPPTTPHHPPTPVPQVLMNYVMVCSMCITSPLILPFGLLYFVGLWGVWRYQALYVYQRQYESGGRFWPLVAHKVVGCQLIMVVFTACVLLFKVCVWGGGGGAGGGALGWLFVGKKNGAGSVRVCHHERRGGTSQRLVCGLKLTARAQVGLLRSAPARESSCPARSPDRRRCCPACPFTGRLHAGGPAVHHAARLPAAL